MREGESEGGREGEREGGREGEREGGREGEMDGGMCVKKVELRGKYKSRS